MAELDIIASAPNLTNAQVALLAAAQLSEMARRDGSWAAAPGKITDIAGQYLKWLDSNS